MNLNNILQTLYVQQEPKLLEGVLSGLDTDIDNGVVATRINKIRVDNPLNCKDMAGRKVKIGDVVFMFYPGQLVIGRIATFDRGGTQVSVEALDNPENIYYPLTNSILKIKNIKKLPDLINVFGL